MRLNINEGFLVVFIHTLSSVKADIYLHNPRGSNNRLDEAGRARNNANRMFDSQNNNRGGYNVGSLYYYSGSKLKIEWTNQHSCNDANSNCEIILQYMCDDLVRDGSDTRQIPEGDGQCNGACNSDFRFGMNENREYYATCKRRIRNKGLFTADQVLGPTAVNTRQNPNGQRYGYECPEERDYYPYWHPTDWIDIAILINDPKRCNFFKQESENVQGRYHCSVPAAFTGLIPNSELECLKIKINNETAEWKQESSHDLPAPVCIQNQQTRDNHLGNAKGSDEPSFFEWTLPNINKERCVLRARYNISTNDYEESQSSGLVSLSEKMNLGPIEAQKRGYLFKTNPSVQLFSDLDLKLNLAINTQQFGRTFQDRSHAFSIRQRSPDLANAQIHNLNVRGKRGNIVQVYPAVEYDFVPNKLEASKNDFIHVQWTGSNTNPINNDGQGLPGSDRSNILMLRPKAYAKGDSDSHEPLEIFGQYALNYPSYLANTSLIGLEGRDLIRLAILQENQFGGSMDELNDAGTYFDLGPRKITSSGVYRYMCSRNNNFSNRDQKGVIVVQENEFSKENIDENGGVIETETVKLTIPPGAFEKLSRVRVDIKTKEQILNDLRRTADSLAIDNLKKFDVTDLSSDFIFIEFSESAKKPIEVTLELINGPGAMAVANVYRISVDYSSFAKLSSKMTVGSKRVKFEIEEHGIYMAKNESDWSVLIGTLVGVFLVLVLVASVVVFFRRNPKYLERIRYSAGNVKRSVSNKI